VAQVLRVGRYNRVMFLVHFKGCFVARRALVKSALRHDGSCLPYLG